MADGFNQMNLNTTHHRTKPQGAFSKRLKGVFLVGLVLLTGCAAADVPDPRDVNIPNPTFAEKRRNAVNEKPDSVMYLPLGRDVLLPEVASDDPLPEADVGPFELRGETLAGALQLILADYDVPLSFESDEGLTKTISVANLRGPLSKVVRRVCGLAELYCSFEDGVLVVKKTQTFTVKIPPISQDTAFMQNVATGLQAVTGTTPIIDASTRTIIYTASQRTADMALRYFQRMRASTAMIVFETYIWEVSLNAGNSTGINWQLLDTIGKYNVGVQLKGSVGADFTNPVSIGLPSTGNIATNGVLSATKVFNFLSTFGAVKTISQPQITVLSGSSATLRAADRQNYVSNISETLNNGQSTTAVSTDSVDTGFTMTIKSAWDNATVYADINVALTDVLSIQDFQFQASTGGSTKIQLPKTTEREVTTQVRIRPGDSLLIAGLVREGDSYDSSGPGFMKPVVPTSRTTKTNNLELVIMMRPRVVVYTNPDSDEKHYNAARELPTPNKEGPPELVATKPVEQESLTPIGPPIGPVSTQPIDKPLIKPEDSMPLPAVPVPALPPTDLLDPSFLTPPATVSPKQ